MSHSAATPSTPQPEPLPIVGRVRHDVDMSTAHGTYRIADGSKVDFSEALDAWVPVAYEILLEVARHYNALTTYQELTQRVQETAGIRTRMLIGNWSGKLLERVALLAVEQTEVPLTSLCVHKDGTIGSGYQRAPKSVPSDESLDVDDLAAWHRLLCYRKYAADLPADGGQPTVTPQVAEARARRSATVRPPAPLCEKHFLRLSITGVCAMCE